MLKHRNIFFFQKFCAVLHTVLEYMHGEERRVNTRHSIGWFFVFFLLHCLLGQSKKLMSTSFVKCEIKCHYDSFSQVVEFREAVNHGQEIF